MKAVYFFSPLPPIRSGVARYTHLLANKLSARGYDVRVVVDQDEVSGPAEYRVVNRKKLLYSKLREDAAIFYQIGNHAVHHYMIPFVLSYPGIIVLHDLFLTDARLDRLRRYYSEEEILSDLSYCLKSDQTAAILAQALVPKIGSPFYGSASLDLNRILVEASVGVILHNPDAARTVMEEYPHHSVFPVPMAVWDSELFRDVPIEVIKAERRKIGIPQDALVLGSFGVMSKYKRLERLIELTARLHSTGIPAYLLIGGYQSERSTVMDLAREHSLATYVRQLVDLSQTEYWNMLKVADIILSLRFPSFGEFSSSAAEGMASARPVLMLQSRFSAYLPDSVCVQIRPSNEIQDLMDWIVKLWNEPELRMKIGKCAREYIRIQNAWEKMVDGYDRIIKAYPLLKKNWNDPRPGFPPHLRPLEETVRTAVLKKFPGGAPGCVLDALSRATGFAFPSET